VAGGVFQGGLPWGLVGAGMLLAVGVIVLDEILKAQESNFRTPVLAVAVGIYLPFELSVAIFIGGLIAWAVKRGQQAAAEMAPAEQRTALREAAVTGDRHGLLFAAGAITGEALVGILLAIPIVVAGDADVLAFWGDHTDVNYPGIILLILVLFMMYRVASGPTREVIQE
jgi:putative OPT family oligopeptide transporter